MKNSPYKLTPDEEKRLTDELTTYANEGATDDELREFRSAFITELKKKEPSQQGSGAPGQPSGQNFDLEAQRKAVASHGAKIEEQAKQKDRQFLIEQDQIRNLATQYESAQKGYEYAIDVERKFDLGDNETVKAFLGGEWGASVNEQNEQRKSAKSKIDALKKEKLGYVNYAQEKISDTVNQLANDAIGGNVGKFTMTGGVTGKIVVPDPYVIGKEADRLASIYGQTPESSFRRLMYDTLTGAVSTKLIEPRAKEIFEPKKQEIEAKIGKQFEDSFTTDDVEYKKAEIQIAELGKVYTQKADAESKPLIDQYKSAVDAVNQKIQSLNVGLEALNKSFESGAMSPEDYKARFDATSAEIEKVKAEFPSYDDFAKQINGINSRYNQQYRQAAIEIEKAAQARVKKASEKYSKEFQVSPDLQQEYSKAFSDAYKQAFEERNKLIDATEAAFWSMGNLPLANTAIPKIVWTATVNGLGGSLKGLGVTLQIPELETFGDYLEKKNTISQPRSGEVSDLFDGRNLTKLTGQLAGGMAPSIAAAAFTSFVTGGAGTPEAVQMLAAGLSSWAAETADISGRAYDQKFQETGNAGEARLAANRSFDSQVDIILAYALEGLPFVSKGLSMVPTVPGRVVAGGMIEVGSETIQETLQNIAEENIQQGRKPWEMATGEKMGVKDFFNKAGETMISVAPVAILGGAGQITSQSRDQAMNKSAIAYASKVKLNDVIEDQGRQFVYSTVFNKGDKYAAAVVNAMFTSGQINEGTKNQMLTDVAQASAYSEKAKKLKLSPNDAMIYSWISSKADEATANAANYASDPVMAEVFSNQAKEYQQQAMDFVSGKDPNFYSVQYADGSEYLMSISDGAQAFTDPKMIEEVKAGNVRLYAFGDDAAAGLKVLETNVNKYQGKSNTADVLNEVKTGEKAAGAPVQQPEIKIEPIQQTEQAPEIKTDEPSKVAQPVANPFLGLADDLEENEETGQQTSGVPESGDGRSNQQTSGADGNMAVPKAQEDAEKKKLIDAVNSFAPKSIGGMAWQEGLSNPETFDATVQEIREQAVNNEDQVRKAIGDAAADIVFGKSQPGTLKDVESTAKALEIKNEGKAESPTKESVTERLNINNPFYKKVEDALVKLGLIEKYNPETKTGDVIGGYVQSDGRGGFASGDMYFEVDGVIKYRKDGNVVEFDRNGNVVSENTQNVKSEKAKTEIEGRKKSIQFLKDTRDSDAFKYKEETEFDKLGNRKKIKRLKTDEELKESTNKINEQIDKAEKELAALNQQSQGYKAGDVEATAITNLELRKKYGLESLKPTYRGTSMEEWEAVKSGKPFKSKDGFGENESETTWVSDKKEYSEEYAKVNEGVLIEFKPEAIDKSGVESGQQNDDTGVRLGRGLNLSDVQRVTDYKGNVIYEAGKQPTTQSEVEATAKALEGVDKTKLPKVKVENEDASALRNAKTKEQVDAALIQVSQESSVSKALDNLGFLLSGIKEKYYNKDYSWGSDLADEIEKISKNTTTDPKSISEAYHKAKADGSNPELVKAVEDLLGSQKPSVQETGTEVKGEQEPKPSFENVPVITRTEEEIEFAKNEVFDNLNKLQIGSVIENSDGEIKVVTEKSTDKKGNTWIGVVTYERQSDGSLIQLTNPVWAIKTADGKIKLDYNPHSTGTNSKGERVTVTDQITDKKIDLSKENIFTNDENGNLIQINKANQIVSKKEEKIDTTENEVTNLSGYEKTEIETLADASDATEKYFIVKKGVKSITGAGSGSGTYISDLVRISDHKAGKKQDYSHLNIGNFPEADIRVKNWNEIHDLIPKMEKFIDEYYSRDWEEEGVDNQDIKQTLINEIFKSNENKAEQHDKQTGTEVKGEQVTSKKEEPTNVSKPEGQRTSITTTPIEDVAEQEIVDQSGAPSQNIIIGSVPKPKPEADKKPERKVRDENLKKDIDNALKDLLDGLGGTLSSGGIDPKRLEAAIKLIGLYTKAGVYKFSDIVEDAVAKYGDAISKLFDELKAAYAAYKESQATDEEHEQMDASVRGLKYQDIIGPDKIDDEPISDVSKKREFIDAVKEFILDDVKIGGIIHLRKIADGIGLKYELDTELQEYVEFAVVEISRDVANSPTLSNQQKFDWIQKVYSYQPTISQRSSNRIELQQYSTPIPMAFTAGMWVKQINPSSVLEPSAGNGALTINFMPGDVVVNEIDSTRINNLKEQGFREVRNQSASDVFDGTFDGIVMNPPFGKADTVEVDGYKIQGLDPQMTVNALNNLSQNGRAAIIIGGHNEYGPDGKMTGNERFFFNYLYSHYNVADVINMDGSMYYKQGTTFPVRMILIDGRKPSPDTSVAPRFNESLNTPISDYQQLFDRISKTIKDNETRTTNQLPMDANMGYGDAVRGSGSSGGNQAAGSSGVRNPSSANAQQNAGGGIKGGVSSTSSGSGNTGQQQQSGTNQGSYTSQRPISQQEEAVPPGRKTAQDRANQRGGDGNTIADNRSVRNRKPVDLTQPKTLYEPQSNAKGVDSYVSSSVATEAYHALNTLENKIGMTVDDYVASKLKYDSAQDMQQYFSAEQADALALAIYNMETGSSLIVGDMTGVGKGRIAAGIIRYCIMNGKRPMFLTVKPELFTDMYRDLNDIGFVDVKPFIVNNDVKIMDPRVVPGGKESVLHRVEKSAHKALIDNVNKGNTDALNSYDAIFSTYSQFQLGVSTDPNGTTITGIKPNSKADFFLRASANSVLIMDESHLASGDSSKLGLLFRMGLERADSAIFLSATFAKRPSNMVVYADKTAISEANMTRDQLVEAIARGGIPLQEIISSQLVQIGQMVRRERLFYDWQTEYIELKDKEQDHREKADKLTSIARDIMTFEKEFIKPYVSGINEDLKDGVDSVIASPGDVGATRVAFASKMFNMVDQMLFAIKAEAAATEAVKAFKEEGLKPVIAFKSTMGAFLFDQENGLGLKNGDFLNENFSVVMGRALDKSLEYTERKSTGESAKVKIRLTDLPIEAQLAYKKIEDKISAAGEGIPLSPIDAMIRVLEKAGLRVGEITGRTERIQYNEDGTGIAIPRAERNVTSTVAKFNSGEIDVLLINQSGATGISMHASSKFKDQKQRVMIMVQPELDINLEVQKRGRIDRTGQVVRGLYRGIVSMIPAEMRLWMMYKNKIKSLDANTSGDQKSTKESINTSDFLNEVGDRVVYNYLFDNPDINAKLDDPLKLFGQDSEGGRGQEDSGYDGAATKVTGKVAALSMADQERFYSEVSELYRKEIEYLESNDMNPLESKTLDLKAEVVSRQVVKAGMPNSTSPFGSESVLEISEVNVLKKPMKSSEIEVRTNEIIEGKDKREYKLGLIDSVEKYQEETEEKISKENEQEREAAKTRQIAMLDKKVSEINAEKPGEITQQGRNERAAAIIATVDAEYKDRKDRAIAKLESDLSMASKRFSFFNVGEIYPVGTDLFSSNQEGGGYVRGVFMGYEIGKRTKNPYASSNVVMVFATADGRREVKIPISKSDVINEIVKNNQYLSDAEKDFSKWDSTTKTEAREQREIITGNILQAMASYKGQLVVYTTKDGRIKKGLLLRKGSDIAKAKQIMVPLSTAIKIAEQSANKKGMAGWLVSAKDASENIDIIISFDGRSEGMISVPAAKNLGGKYYLDPRIREMVASQNFFTRSGRMVADIRGLENMLSLIDYLTREKRLQALVSSEAYNSANNPSSDGGLKNDLDSAIEDLPEFQKTEDAINQIGDPKLKDRISGIVNALEKLSPGTRVVVHNDPAEYEKAAAATGLKTDVKKTAAFHDPVTGDIHINVKNVSSTTAFHESAHPILAVMMELNPSLLDELYDQIESDPALARFVAFGKQYESAEDQKIEAVIEFLAAVADGQLDSYQNTPLWDKIKAFFNRLFRYFTGKNTFDISLDDVTELKKFAGKFATAVRSGLPVRNTLQERISGAIPRAQISKKEQAIQNIKNAILKSYNQAMSVEEIASMINQEPRVKALIEEISSVEDFIDSALYVPPVKPSPEPATTEITGAMGDDAYVFPQEGTGPLQDKTTVKRLIEGDAEESLKNAVSALGTQYETRSHYEADLLAKEFIEKVGLGNAVKASLNMNVPPDIAMMVLGYASMNLNEIGDIPGVPNLVQSISLLGRSYGRGVAAIQYLYEQYNVGYSVDMEIEKYKAANDGYIPEIVEKKFRDMDAEMNALKDEVKALEEERQRLETEVAIQNIKDDIERERKGNLPQKERAKLSEKIRKAKITRPTVFNSSNPAVVVWDGAVELVASSVEAGEMLSVAIKKGINHITESDWYKSLDSKTKKEAVKAFADEMGQDTVADPYVNDRDKLIIPNSFLRKLIEEGYEDIRDLTEVVRQIVNDLYPEYQFSEREVRDAITKYGETIPTDPEKAAELLRKAKRVGRVISAIEDVQQKMRPLRSGQQRDKLDAEERQMQKELRELMKDLPMDDEAGQNELKSALDAIKSRLRNAIEDLQFQIDTGTRTAKAKGIEWDDEAKDLAEQRDELKKRRDALFGEPMSDEKRIALAERLLEANLKKLEEKIANNDPSFKQSQKVDSPKIQALREAIKTNNEILNEIREQIGLNNQRRLNSLKKAALKRETELEAAIRSGTLPKKKPRKTIPDDELSKKRARISELREEMNQMILDAELKNFKKAKAWWNIADQLYNVSRTMIASLEFSLVLIQGGPLTVKMLFTDPKTLGEAFSKLWQNAKSESKQRQFQQLIKEWPYYTEAKAAGLSLTEFGAPINKAEEGFIRGWGHMILELPFYLGGRKGKEFGEKVNPAKFFERGGSTYLNILRMKQYEILSDAIKAQGYSITNNPKMFKDAAGAINMWTGRAGLGKAEAFSKPLAYALFSPKNWYSQIRQTTPIGLLYFISQTDTEHGLKGAKLSPTQKQSALIWTLYMAAMTTVALSWRAAFGDDDDEGDKDGKSISLDPRSSDFMKPKIGYTRLDPWGGKSQMMTFMARMATGQYIDSKGNIREIGEYDAEMKQKNKTRWDLLKQMTENKLHPTLGFAIDRADISVNKYGQPVDDYGNVVLLKDQLGGLIVPMYFASIKENFEAHSDATAIALTGIGLFGMGTNTYGTPKERIKKEYMKLLGIYEYESGKEASEGVKKSLQKQAEIAIKQKTIEEKYNIGQ